MNEVSSDAYVLALREDVCSICACYSPDGNPNGSCSHESSGTCVVFRHLAETISIVSRFHGSALRSYDNAYQMYACTRCHLADCEGICTMRDRTRAVPDWCIADAYLPQIVGAIERVQEVHVD